MRLLPVLACVLVVSLYLSAHVVEGRKCRREKRSSKCVPRGTCVAGVTVAGLCDPTSGTECCLPGTDDLCTSEGGRCVRDGDCKTGTAFDGRCPGTSQIVCCVPPHEGLIPYAPGRDYSKVIPPAVARKKWRQLVNNRINDIADYLVTNLTLPEHAVSNNTRFCWPLQRSSTKKMTVTEVSWGSTRENGRRCHAGVNMFTSTPGLVVSIGDGEVIAKHPVYTYCSRGWGLIPKKLTPVASVMIYYESINSTVNYAELDPQQIRVHLGQRVRKGAVIGVASFCGMLNFELYAGRQERFITWRPPASVTLPAYGNLCATMYLDSKPEQLLDPRPLLTSLEGKFCS